MHRKLYSVNRQEDRSSGIESLWAKQVLGKWWESWRVELVVKVTEQGEIMEAMMSVVYIQSGRRNYSKFSRLPRPTRRVKMYHGCNVFISFHALIVLYHYLSIFCGLIWVDEIERDLHLDWWGLGHKC